ncbi:MAG: restriction endonuclease [Mycobacteriales bacterium]
MELTELLDVLDRTAANVEKLERVWARAESFIPTGPTIPGAEPEYDDLQRAWADLLPGLPPIDGWTITEGLPDLEEIGRAHIDWLEIGELPPSYLFEAGEKPGKDLAEYRYKLNRTRRRAVRDRLNELIGVFDAGLPVLLADVPRGSGDVLDGDLFDQLRAVVPEIERLMGDTARQSDRWSDLRRHMRFSEGHDWHDILEVDWPSVRVDVEAAGRGDADPLPVPDLDLGLAAAGQLTGGATSALPWDRVDDAGFERLLYDLLRDLPGHQNVQWLQRTRAADRGRDLSCERVTETGAGSTRTERVIVQAKHWLSKSVGAAEISANVTNMALQAPPVVRVLIAATSGAFTLDAVEWVERHNDKAATPFIELWPHSHLEMLLAQRPALAAAHGLR